VGRPVVHDVSLALGQGSFCALLGPSGSGKTTLLRLVGGYLAPAAGRISLAGRDVTDLPPERRGVGMVFQNYALFPHLSARDNVAFGPEVRGVSRAAARRRADDLLDLVGLAPGERDRKPARLSGGQQQRVALARALAIEPALLLLDEPLSSLDRRLREQLRGELVDLQRRTGVTALLVTHDQEEALALADRVGILARGRLLQVGTPRELYERPCCPFVASFLGEANLLVVERRESGAVHFRGGLHLQSVPPALHPAEVGDQVLIRPGGVLVSGGETGLCLGEGTVAASTFRGEQVLLRVRLADTHLLAVCRSAAAPQPGAVVGVSLDPAALWLLPGPDPTWLEAP
jgi:ABC-type Fe3+/spermidine/putrescine transport system ATPase subunit